MNEAKAEMHGSYLALFYVTCGIVLLQLVIESKVGPVVWGLAAWQVYRRNKATLLIGLRILFWCVVAGGIGSFIWLVADPLNASVRSFVETEGYNLAISAGLFWWMRAFFERSSVAEDIFGAGIARAQAPASADIAPAYGLAPEPPARKLFTRIVESPAPERPVENIPTGEVASPAPQPSAENIHALAMTQAAAPAEAATVERLSPEPQARNFRVRVLARAKQLLSWRRRPKPPALPGIPPAAAGDVADRGGVTRTAMPVSPGGDFDGGAVLETAAATSAVRIDEQPATPASSGSLPEVVSEPVISIQDAVVAAIIAEPAPPPTLASKPVAEPPDIKAEPGVFPKTSAAENPDAIRLQAVLDEERIYAAIADELETGGVDKGLWTRLFAECEGDETRTKVFYIRQRAARLMSDERVRSPQEGRSVRGGKRRTKPDGPAR